MQYDPKKRVGAEEAMRDSFFAPLGPEVRLLPDTASIFSVPGLRLTRDPGRPPPGVSGGSTNSLKADLRRFGAAKSHRSTSMLF